MIDVLYLYKKSKWGKELKFSLRSIEKYLNYNRVLVVGDKPPWLDTAYCLQTKRRQDKFEDVNHKLKLGLEAIPKGRLVLLMHDDMYLLKKYDIIKYYNGTLGERFSTIGGERSRVIARTMPIVGSDSPNYEIHYPMPFINMIEWQTDEPLSYMSVLGNTLTTPSREVEDCKFKNPTIKQLEGLPCFSTHSETDDLLTLMLKLYPFKSSFEL